jgi:uncharacterized protein
VQIRPLLLSLPTADRVRAHTFYREALALEAPGPVADDGVPEPLVFELSDAVQLMFVPTGGFGWVLDGRQVAEPSASECILGIQATTAAEVRERFERARAAGATTVTEPGDKPWGYTAAFADPDGHVWTVTCESTPG